MAEIYNDNDNTLLSGTSGNDWIENDGSNVTISGGDGNNTIVVGAGYGGGDIKNVLINVGNGNDLIYNDGDNAIINSNDGDDTISNDGVNVTINAGAGNDKIFNYYSAENDKLVINGGTGDDYIFNDERTNVSILGGLGNDFISLGSNAYSDIFIQYTEGDGNDIIYGFKADLPLQIASGKVSSVMKFLDSNDICVAVGNDTITLAGIGEDSINLVDYKGKHINYTLHIVGTDNADYIYSGYGAKTFIHGESGDDTVENFYSYVTIDGGKGNDSIENSGDKCSILSGEDDDYIWNGQSDYYPTKGDKTSIDAGAGNDTVINYGASVSINGGADNDSIKNSGDKVTIIGETGDDSIINSGGKVSIESGTGNNTLSNGFLKFHTEKVISNYVHGVPLYKDILVADESILGGSNVKITADKDNDVIQNVGGSKITIDAGAGDNQVSLIGAGKTISVDAGEGNDSIFALSFEEDVHFNQEAYKVGNGSKITIDAGGGRNLISVGSGWSYVTINGGDEKDIVVNSANKAIIKTGALNDLIKNYGSNVTIDGGEDFDTIINFGSKVSINGGDGTRNSENYIYSDATNVTINGGKNDDRILAYNDIGASVNAGDGNDYIALQRVQWKDILNSFVDALDVSKSLLEENVEKATVGLSKDWLKKNFLNENFGTLLESVSKVSSTIQKYAGWFNIIESYYKKTSASSTIIGGKGDDIIVNDGVAPKIFEYEDGDGDDTIYYFNTNKALKANLNLEAQSLFLSTLHIKTGLVKEVALDGNDVIIKVGKGSVRLVDGIGKKFKLREANGYTTTRAYDRDSNGEIICTIFGSSKNDELKDYVGFKKESYIITPDSPTPKDKIIGTVNKNVIYGNGGKDTVRANDINSSLYGGAKNDILYGGNGKDTLSGEAGNDKLYGDKGNDSLSGGDGKDTLDGGSNNDRLHGGAGNDSLVGGDGNDKLYGESDNDKLYGDAGKDTLWGGFGEDKLYGGEDNDKLLGEWDNDTLKGGDGDDTLSGGTGNDKLYGEKGNDLLMGGDDKDTISGGEDDDKIFGDAGNDSLRGDSDNDTISGGLDDDKIYGGIGNDSLNGGKGNDKLWGEAGADIFTYKYGDGKDIIYGFENDDILKIMTGFETSYSKKKNCVTFKMYDDGSITLKNFTATTFHVNSDVYQISNSNFVKQN